MALEFDLGAFDVSARVGAEIEWLEHTDDIAVLNMRAQFEKNLELICEQYQKFFTKSLGQAIVKHKMYFEIPDLNMKEMSDDELDNLKTLGN
jgi:hypothetical protein